MIDATINYTEFKQRLVLSKSEYSLFEQGEIGAVFKDEQGTECIPHLYFQPINLTERETEYRFSELLHECYEAHLEMIEQSLQEREECWVVETTFALRSDGEIERLEGLEFVYPDEEFTYRYQVLNSMADYRYFNIADKPLQIVEQEGPDLTGKALEVPLVGSYMCPSS